MQAPTPSDPAECAPNTQKNETPPLLAVFVIACLSFHHSASVSQ